MTNSPPPAEGRRPTRTSSLSGSAIEDLGARTVGHSREKIDADRRALPRKRLATALVIGVVVVGLPVLYMYSSRKKDRTATSPIAMTKTAEGTDANTVPEALAAKANAATDSFPTIAFDTAPSPAASGSASIPTGTGSAPIAPIGSASPRTAGNASTPAGAGRPVTALPTPTPTNGAGDPPLLPPEPVTPRFGAPTLATRMAVASGFTQMASSGSSGGTVRRVSALVSTAGTGVSSTATTVANAMTAPPAITPGSHASAVVLVGGPSAASGEPLTVELTEALVDRGREVLPVGTKGIGKGTSWDDGTGQPRLDINFTHWVLPNGTVRQLAGRAYSTVDDRPGLVVPFSRQIVRKGEGIAANFGAAVAIGKLAEKLLPKPNSGNEALAQAVSPPPMNQAIQDVWRSTQAELNLTRPPVAVLLRLESGMALHVVFGMP